jgi:hypothetical protein
LLELLDHWSDYLSPLCLLFFGPELNGRVLRFAVVVIATAGVAAVATITPTAISTITITGTASERG